MRHIVMFSGGAASSVVAQMVAAEHPTDTILLHTPTFAEHPDADRFRAEVAAYIGLPITIERASKGLWQMVESYRNMPNSGIPYCTERLKLIPQDRFLKRLEKRGEEFVIYLGLGRDEWRRIQKVAARNSELGRRCVFPLWDTGLTGADCKGIVAKWGIDLPEPYKYLSHNNCIPCYKGGQGHWYRVWKHYPEQFERACRAEERAENTVFKDTTLRELAAHWATQPEQTMMFDDASQGIPCMCAI